MIPRDSGQRSWIELPDHSRLPLRHFDELAAAQFRLSRVYGIGPARCLCNTAHELEVAICCLHLGAKVRYYLRAHPKSKHLHRDTCVFAQGARTPDEIDAQRAESERLRIEGGFHVREISESPARGSENRGQLRAPTSVPTSALGVIRMLWERASLHVFHPTLPVRTSRSAMERLLEAGDLVTDVGPLRSVTMAVPAGGKDDNLRTLVAHNADVLARASKDRLRVFFVGELNAVPTINEGKKAGAIYIKGLKPQLGWGMAWRREVGESVLRRFAIGVSLINDERARVLLVGTAEPEPQNRTLWIRYAGLLPVSRLFIPCESSYELDVVAQLIGASRTFRKPLSLEYDILPDFELLDTATDRPFPMEVFGRNDESYVDRANEKATIYTREFGSQGWWAWNAALREPMPPLPPRVANQG